MITNIVKPLIGLLIIELLNKPNNTRNGITRVLGICMTLPENVGKLLTIPIEIKINHIPIYNSDFKKINSNNGIAAIGNKTKKAAAGVGIPVK